MLVIFDCDGVLVDTEEINRQALITVLHENGIYVTEAEAAKELQGLSNLGIVEKVKELRGVTLGDRFIRDLEAKESELVRRSVQPVEGVRGAAVDIIDLRVLNMRRFERYASSDAREAHVLGAD